MKIFSGYFGNDNRYHVDVDGVPLDPRYDLEDFDPRGGCGFDWGIDRIQTDQLALALLAFVTGSDQVARTQFRQLARWLHTFKMGANWRLTEDDVREAVRASTAYGFEMV